MSKGEPFLNQKEIPVKSRRNDVAQSKNVVPQAQSQGISVFDPSEIHHANGMDEWSQRVMKNMKRMATDEEYRKEIAKKLS